MLDQATAAPPADQDRPAIVVLAPDNTGKALADCLARKCSLIQDVNATLRHAEALFAMGKYGDARAALLQSLSRNKDQVDKFPHAIAALYEATATVTEHDGDRQKYRYFAFRSAYVLAKAPNLSPLERLTGYMRAGDISAALADGQEFDPDVTFGGPVAAEGYYRAAEELARSNGFDKVAQVLELRRLWVSARRGQSKKQRARLAAIIAAPDTDPGIARHARTILAQLERAEGDESAIDRLMQTVQAQPEGAAPVLLSSPAIPTTLEAANAKDAVRFNEPSLSAPKDGIRHYQWADIGYWVRSDGTVANVEVLRGSASQGWTRPIITMISGRRYLASKVGADDPGQYRIERVTLTYEWTTPIGSSIRRRSGIPSYRFADITRAPAPPPEAEKATPSADPSPA